MPLRTEIVAEAHSWIGTPYRHQASLRRIGCDCLGLVRGVYRALYGSEPGVMPAYGADWTDVQTEELLASGLGRHLDPVSVLAARPGDVLVFRLRRGAPAKHAAIQSENGRMVHAWERGPVASLVLTASWRRRIAYVFSFPDVMD